MKLKSLGKLVEYIAEIETSIDAKYDGILKKGYSFNEPFEDGQNGHHCSTCFLEDNLKNLKYRLREVRKCDCDACHCKDKCQMD